MGPAGEKKWRGNGGEQTKKVFLAKRACRRPRPRPQIEIGFSVSVTYYTMATVPKEQKLRTAQVTDQRSTFPILG